MKKISNIDLNRITVEEFKKEKKTPLILVLDNIRSLNNIGSVFRTSDAFLIEKIYLCGITATPPHKDIHKTAIGATDSVDWEYSESTVDVVNKLRNDGVSIISVEQVDKAVMLNEFSLDRDRKYALIFGNELKGVSQEVVSMSDMSLEIPQYGTKHSLNIAISVGIVVWEVFKKLKL